MTDLLAAMRSAFDAEPVATDIPRVGARHVPIAERAVKNANGSLAMLRHAEAFTTEHAKSLARASAQLRAAAFALEQLGKGVEEHLASGFSMWSGKAGDERPVLL